MLKWILCLPCDPGMMSPRGFSWKYSTFPLKSLLLLFFLSLHATERPRVSVRTFSPWGHRCQPIMCHSDVAQNNSDLSFGLWDDVPPRTERESSTSVRSCQITLPLLESTQPSSGLFYHFRIMSYPKGNVSRHISLQKTVDEARNRSKYFYSSTLKCFWKF